MCLNAEVIHDLDPFRAEVESFDPAAGQLVYKPGKTRSEKLALCRPLVNLNPAKWITGGHVLIVRRGGRFRGETYPDHPAKVGDETIYVRGGPLDLDRPAAVRGGLVEAEGLSATETAARNLRGIDIAVPPGDRVVDVKFATAEPDSRYSLCVQPSWLTAAAVTEKRPEGFRVQFAETAPASDKIDW